ncbi:MAG: radical SAM protein [Bdellovibrionales bacterium]|jgi:hypothetical protein|nr:radical SAM protein [Bdellovibrionales bacterium]MBT3525915.1 radical SAM protein [Bdellovibrionales bacterium]MBT7669139.1 radical SAM protein [Bdellovibrionales bacterium]
MSEKQNSIKKFSPPSKTFCVLPWIHLCTRPNGHLRVCCTANASSVGPTQDKKYGGEVGILKQDGGVPANLNTTDLMSSWNNSYMRHIRLQMLQGLKPPSCLKCFKEEECGHQSKRNWETAFWANRIDIDQLLLDTKDDGAVPPQISYIDLRMGTKCNLKCIMCSPHDSSLWIPDWQELYPLIENTNLKENMQWSNKGKYDGATYNWHQNNPKFWQQLYQQIPNLHQLYFAGGESTIIEEHYSLLEECIKRGYAKNIQLRYNSNGVELPTRLFDLWEKFRDVRFHYSVDSIGRMNDYIRFPFAWQDTVKQFWHLDNNAPDNVEITTACAVSALNIYYLPDFVRWKVSQNFKRVNLWPSGAGLINWHFVYHPVHLNVKVLPNWFKQQCREKYEEFYPWMVENWELAGAPSQHDFTTSKFGLKRMEGMINFMCAEDWSVRMPEFKEYIIRMDKIRSTNFQEIFPEMAELID